MPPEIILLNPPPNISFQLRKPLVSPNIVGIHFYQFIFNTPFISYCQLWSSNARNDEAKEQTISHHAKEQKLVLVFVPTQKYAWTTTFWIEHYFDLSPITKSWFSYNTWALKKPILIWIHSMVWRYKSNPQFGGYFLVTIMADMNPSRNLEVWI